MKLSKRVVTHCGSFLIFFFSLLTCMQARAQKVGDILEKGEVIQRNWNIFIQFDGTNFNYQLGNAVTHKADPLTDSFFLLKSKGVNICMAPPLNPLTFSTAKEISFINDPINANASEALGAIISAIDKMANPVAANPNPNPDPNPGKKKPNKKKPGGELPVVDKTTPQLSPCEIKFFKIKSDFEKIAALLKDDRKSDIIEIFKLLKGLDFTDKKDTRDKIDTAVKHRNIIDTYYNTIRAFLDTAKKDIDAYEPCKTEQSDDFIKLYVIKQIFKDEQELYQNYVQNLKSITDISTLVSSTAANTLGEGKEWYAIIGRVSMQPDKVATCTIAVNDDGYTLSETGKEVTKTTKKIKKSVTLVFRKFQRLVPEVSAGVAFTQLSFPKYGVTTDAAGVQHVENTGEDAFKRMNFASMINFNYYIPNAPVHPFWQIGIGVNAGYPTFFSGVGGRISFAGLRRLAVSTGFAGTWIKTLSTLKAGDVVSGTAQLDKDIKYEFSFPFRPYFGVQYNF